LWCHVIATIQKLYLHHMGDELEMENDIEVDDDEEEYVGFETQDDTLLYDPSIFLPLVIWQCLVYFFNANDTCVCVCVYYH
jgi:hypothetical protein